MRIFDFDMYRYEIKDHTNISPSAVVLYWMIHEKVPQGCEYTYTCNYRDTIKNPLKNIFYYG